MNQESELLMYGENRSWEKYEAFRSQAVHTYVMSSIKSADFGNGWRTFERTPNARNEVDWLSDALQKSNGRAAMIIHPFYPEEDPDNPVNKYFNPSVDKVAYEAYVEGLKDATKRYQDEGLPIMLFLGKDVVSAVNGPQRIAATIARLGIRSGNVFVIPTREGDPLPVWSNEAVGDKSGWLDRDEQMKGAMEFLSSIGLEQPVISGSNLLLCEVVDKISKRIRSAIPQFMKAKRYDIEGCVGDVLLKCIESDMTIDVEEAASYPRRYPPFEEA